MNLTEGLAHLTRLGGRPVSETALRARLTLDAGGQPSLDAMADALAAGGFALQRHRGPYEALAGQAGPALAALDDGSYRLVNAGSAGQGAEHDNAERARYAGWWLAVSALPEPDRRSGLPVRRSARAWFWQVLWRLRGYYVHVALATLVANVLSLAVSLYTMNVYDRVVPNRTYETLWVLTIGACVALLFDFLARTLRGWLLDSAGKRADLEISSGLFRHMLEMRLVDKPASSGSFVNNLRDFESIRDVLTSATLTALIDLPFFLLFVAVIFAIAPMLALVPLVAIVVVALAGAIAQGPLSRLIRESMKEASQRQGLAVEAVEGLETLKVNNAAGHSQQRWEWYTERVADSAARSRHLSSMVINLTATVQQLASIATVVAGVYLIHANELTMGGLIGAVILCGRAIAPLGQLAALAVRIQQARSAFDGLQALMDKPVEREADRTYLSLPAVRGELVLDRVDFVHDRQGAGLFRGLSLAIRAGERVAILGRTGSGKSTLLRLGAGLYAPQSGQVTLDGLDLRQIDPADLRSAIGLLPQDARLFLGSLRENLELARRDRAGDDARLIEVMRQFGLDRFVSQHPRGLDMLLGEDGLGLSGGQKRLVGLARVALRDPQVALLDEPTSGLDPATEKQILQALASWQAAGERPRTLVIVTHRPQVLDIVDRVIVLEAGRVVADGPRARVLEQLSRGLQVSQGAGA
jgi:ATP-binding cassette subfamily C protein LapB